MAPRYLAPMTRRGIPPDRRRAAAHRASRRMIARGDRPTYHVTFARSGSRTVVEFEWLHLEAQGRRDALAAAHSAIAAWLDVSPDAFDLDPRPMYRT